jgi:S1-C subfamily serine protease
MGQPERVLIVRVPPDTAAAKAELRTNDVILRINATAVANWDEFNAVWQGVSDFARVQLTVWREQERCEIELRPSS